MGNLIAKAVESAAPPLFYGGVEEAARTPLALRASIEFLKATLESVKRTTYGESLFDFWLGAARSVQPLDEVRDHEGFKCGLGVEDGEAVFVPLETAIGLEVPAVDRGGGFAARRPRQS